jgi:hypothetical protein
VLANNDDYSRVDTLLFSNPNAERFQFIRKTEGKASIRFGNGTYGKAPINAEIKVAYFSGGGAGANVKNPAMIKTYAGAHDKIAGCSNLTPFAGGSDEKNLETARFLAAGALKSRDRFVTCADGEFLAMSFGGIALAKVIPNAYGVLSAKVVAVTDGGGNPAALLKTDLLAYLTERTVLNSINVFVEDTIFRNFNAALTLTIKSDYDADFIRTAATLGACLFLDETSYEILGVYNSDGVSAAADKIKDIYNTDLTEDFYPIMENFFDFLNEFGPNTFGRTLYEAQFVTFFTIAIPGIINISINLATAFLITIAPDQIAHVASLSVSVVKL